MHTFRYYTRILWVQSILIVLLSQACTLPDHHTEFDPVNSMYRFNKSDKLFDEGWKFFKGDAMGAEAPDYDDTNWRNIDLPYDWSIEDLGETHTAFKELDPKPAGPFSPDSPGDISTGFVLGGIGWYRKHFRINPEDIGKIIRLTFDGIYMNSEIFINGKHVGSHPYGYTPFNLDITPYLYLDGRNNVLAVRVANTGRNSRWYSGSGIYRHVWISLTDPLHLDRMGMFVYTSDVTHEYAKVNVDASVINYFDHLLEAEVRTEIIDPDGEAVSELHQSISLAPGETGIVHIEESIQAPRLWSIDNPELYLVRMSLLRDGREADQLSSTLGIRDIKFSVEKGFQLNGETVLIKGGNMHHDNGPLGAAAIDRAEYRRVELMKAYGFNAIRTSHNPPSRQFLDACDQLGLLVMDESFDQWQRPKNPEDYNLYFDDWWEKDIEAMVKRDRNHPSVIIWSIGNEINERADSSGLELTKLLKRKVKSLDPTRPVTAAICRFWEFPGRPWEDTEPAFELLDIAGYNYQWQRYEDDHKKFPERIILGTESIALEVFENWIMVEKYPWVLGDFVWTSMDYLGEAGIGNALLDSETKGWPWFNAYCGDIDLCGFKKPQSHYRDVVWGISPLEIAVHRPLPEGRKEIVSFWGWPDEMQSWNWTGHEGEDMAISIYSRLDSVVLELNGKKAASTVFVDSMKYRATIKIPYAPGELIAKGYLNGALSELKTLKTTGKARSIKLTVDRNTIYADRNDLAYITAEILDESGIRIPDAEEVLSFRIEGNGELAGVGNGNPTDIKSFQSPFCTTFNGRCLLIVRPLKEETGEVLVHAASDNIEKEASIAVEIMKK